MLQVVEQLPPGQSAWCLLPMEQSFENQVITAMATTEKWRHLPLAPPFWHYEALAQEHRLRVLHYDPRRFYLEGPRLKGWLEQELAPRLHIPPEERASFAEDFLSTYGLTWAIGTALLIQVAPQE